MNKFSVALWFLVSLTSVPSILHAQQLGWYGGAAAGLSNVGVTQDFWTDPSITNPSLDTSGFAYQLFAGYRLHNHVALEINYLQPANTAFKGVSNGTVTIWLPGNIVGATRVDGVSLNTLLFWPGNGANRQLYVKGGLLFWNTTTRYLTGTINGIVEYNNDGVTPIGGAGVQVRVAEGWDMRAEVLYSMVQLASRANVGMSFANIGISHSFR